MRASKVHDELTLRELERVRDAVAEEGGLRLQAARRLGITPKELRRRIRACQQAGIDVVLPPDEQPVELKKSEGQIPERRHLSMAERAASAVQLHLARAHAAVEQVAREFHHTLANPLVVKLSTPLAEFIGDCEQRVRGVNDLEEAGVLTVGDFLDMVHVHGYSPPFANVGPTTVANLAVAMLAAALGEGQICP